MAGKARRVASRQAQLSRKRKKQQKGVAAPASTVIAPAEVDGQHTETPSPMVVEPTSPSSAPAPTPMPARPVATTAVASRSAPTSRAPGRARGERPATYNYIGAEMRRILSLAIVVLAIIVVLGFVI